VISLVEQGEVINDVDPLVDMVHDPEEILPDDEGDEFLVEPHEDYVPENDGTVDAVFQPENDPGDLTGVALRIHQLWIPRKTLLEHSYSVTA
jgi:hypothetical protein